MGSCWICEDIVTLGAVCKAWRRLVANIQAPGVVVNVSPVPAQIPQGKAPGKAPLPKPKAPLNLTPEKAPPEFKVPPTQPKQQAPVTPKLRGVAPPVKEPPTQQQQVQQQGQQQVQQQGQ